jgi:hypothetical protein
MGGDKVADYIGRTDERICPRRELGGAWDPGCPRAVGLVVKKSPGGDALPVWGK